MGQASTYTPELGAAICERLAEGQSLLRATRELGIPYSTARQWEMDVPEHVTNSLRAREIGCHALADECLDIADDGRNDWMSQAGNEDAGWRANGEHVQRSRMRVDTRMRLLGKWLPKVYGEKSTTEHTGPNGGAIVLQASTPSDVDL